MTGPSGIGCGVSAICARAMERGAPRLNEVNVTLESRIVGAAGKVVPSATGLPKSGATIFSADGAEVDTVTGTITGTGESTALVFRFQGPRKRTRHPASNRRIAY